MISDHTDFQKGEKHDSSDSGGSEWCNFKVGLRQTFCVTDKQISTAN